METTPVGKPLLESVIRQLTYWNISVVTHAAPVLKTAVSSQSKSAGMEKAFAKFDKGSLVNWNCVFNVNSFISFSPPLPFRFCTGLYTYTEILRQHVVGVTKVKFRDKLWRCKKGNTGKWYICSVAAQTCTLTQLPCVSEFSPFGSWEVQCAGDGWERSWGLPPKCLEKLDSSSWYFTANKHLKLSDMTAYHRFKGVTCVVCHTPAACIF